MKNMDRRKLMSIITQVSFAIDDVKLFLDTHPNCAEALSYYETAKKMRDEAVDEYTKRFGPISAYNVDVKDYWTWNVGPMPWEGDDC